MHRRTADGAGVAWWAGRGRRAALSSLFFGVQNAFEPLFRRWPPGGGSIGGPSTVAALPEGLGAAGGLFLSEMTSAK